VIPLAQSVEQLVQKARTGRLGTNDQDYQALVRRANQGVQDAQNALSRIDGAGGARSGVSSNKVI
jgi:hypothetical protein